MRCDKQRLNRENLTLVFQSTHLREVRQDVRLKAVKYDAFQSTHLREVRLSIDRIDVNGNYVSIHAPA